MEDNIAICGGIAYFAEHFAHEKYNSIWKMPSVLLTDSLTLELEGKFYCHLVIVKLSMEFINILLFVFICNLRPATMARRRKTLPTR